MAIYTHCYNHQLNLALEEACSEVVIVRNSIGTSKVIHSFIKASAKRYDIFKTLQKEHNISSEIQLKRSLKLLCGTRWASRDKAFEAINENIKIIISALMCIEKNDDNNSAASARSLLLAVANFEFRFTSSVLSELFKVVNILSMCLQSINLDYCQALQIANSTIEQLRKKNNLSHFKSKFLQCLELCEELEISLPELKQKRKLPHKLADDNNYSPYENHDTIENKYFCMFGEIYSKTIQEMEDRFNGKNEIICFIYKIFSENQEKLELKNLEEELSIYKSIIDIEMLHREILLWNNIKLT